MPVHGWGSRQLAHATGHTGQRQQKLCKWLSENGHVQGMLACCMTSMVSPSCGKFAGRGPIVGWRPNDRHGLRQWFASSCASLRTVVPFERTLPRA
eukprot:3623095-Amphidinium_carterae.1